MLAGVAAKKSFEAARAALKADDVEGFLTAGGLTVLNAIGTLPGVGNALKPAIKGAKVGLYRLAGKKGETFEEFIERLSKNAETPARKRQSITEFVTEMVDDGWLKGLSQTDRDNALRAFRTIFAEGAEGYVARRIAQLQKPGAPRALGQQSLATGQRGVPSSRADLLIFGDDSSLQFAVGRRRGKVFQLASTLAIVAEVKAGRGTLTAAQKRIKDELKRLGREGDFKELLVPLHRIEIDDLLEIAVNQTKGMPRALRPELRDQIVAQLEAKLPPETPTWLFFDTYARFVALLPREAFDNAPTR